MQRFFSSLCELDHFTHSLDSLSFDFQCPHCSRNDQWISHGYVCKQSGEKVGKRILCARRYGKQGCGRTRQLYLQDVIPHRRYTLSKLLAFIVALFKGLTVEQAYFHAASHHHCSHRQAWRWLTSLWTRMSRFRSALTIPSNPDIEATPYRSRRLSILLPTLRVFLDRLSDQYAVQVMLQDRFC